MRRGGILTRRLGPGTTTQGEPGASPDHAEQRLASHSIAQAAMDLLSLKSTPSCSFARYSEPGTTPSTCNQPSCSLARYSYQGGSIKQENTHTQTKKSHWNIAEPKQTPPTAPEAHPDISKTLNTSIPQAIVRSGLCKRQVGWTLKTIQNSNKTFFLSQAPTTQTHNTSQRASDLIQRSYNKHGNIKPSCSINFLDSERHSKLDNTRTMTSILLNQLECAVIMLHYIKKIAKACSHVNKCTMPRPLLECHPTCTAPFSGKGSDNMQCVCIQTGSIAAVSTGTIIPIIIHHLLCNWPKRSDVAKNCNTKHHNHR